MSSDHVPTKDQPTETRAGMQRSDFLKRVGGVTVGAMSLGGLLPGVGGTALAASAKPHKIAGLDQALDQAHIESFNLPINSYLKAKAPGWTATYGNENNAVTTGLTLAQEYAAENYPVFFLLTADAMSTSRGACELQRVVLPQGLWARDRCRCCRVGEAQ
jgi:hypothetical protein